MNSTLVNNVRRIARKKKVTLARLVEAYLKQIIRKSAEEPTISPLVKSMSGVMKLPKDFAHKKAYTGYVSKKY
jgi:hypothetical protein